MVRVYTTWPRKLYIVPDQPLPSDTQIATSKSLEMKKKLIYKRNNENKSLRTNWSIKTTFSCEIKVLFAWEKIYLFKSEKTKWKEIFIWKNINLIYYILNFRGHSCTSGGNICFPVIENLGRPDFGFLRLDMLKETSQISW